MHVLCVREKSVGARLWQRGAEPTFEHAVMSRTGVPVTALMSAAYAEFGW